MTPKDKKYFNKFAFELNYKDIVPASYGYDASWNYSEKTAERYEKAL
jgi:hypothetical protein